MPDDVNSMLWGGTTTHNGSGIFAHSTINPSIHLIDNPLEQIEIAADLLAVGIITSDNYFKLKALLRSIDPEVRAMGLKFIDEKSKLEI
jgi:hypothetical protein